MTVTQSPTKWSSQFAFLAAAIGSAVGISNIWKFTYVAGENGGGLFIAVYVIALIVISIPALIAELLIGRSGGKSVVGTMAVLKRDQGISKYWRYYGFMAALGVFLALSFYCVIAGWTLDYFVQSVSGGLQEVNADKSNSLFANLMTSPVRLMASQAVFLVLTALVVALGVKSGLERVLRWLTPGLFIILLLLVLYAVIAGDLVSALKFMFVPNLEQFSANVILMAVGQAFFSLGVGLGVLMTIGAYMKQEFSLVRAALVVAAADGGVAILSGIAIFPIVFAFDLSPAGGPGLIFQTLPVAFGQMPGGEIFGPIFFLLLAMAALTSSITIMETLVAWLEETTSLARPVLAALSALAIFILGLATVFSFNVWADFKPLSMFPLFADKTLFGLIDYLVSNILMPAGGILVAVLAGWAMTRDQVRAQLNTVSDTWFGIWYSLVRYLVPIAVASVFLINLF
ncbi:sodium-dependent transporter [Halioxenophilus aromaticivorans]|uniref:Sodium-dependent transporter n=1 Tax=Halioxenophilus aromaticivorans TaxID=1306992 RepID=A0AAV3TYF5_9ALTE